MLKLLFNFVICLSLLVGYSAKALEAVCAYDTVAVTGVDTHLHHDEASNADQNEECHSNCEPCHAHHIALLASPPTTLSPSKSLKDETLHSRINGVSTSPPYKPNWP
jgi:hypothetical protein